MFRRALPLLCSKPPRESTGLVGIDVVPNAREVLLDLYSKTLRQVADIPQGAAYRRHVERFTKHRMNIVSRETDIQRIENQIGIEPIELLIMHARDELELIPKMIEWKPWLVDGKLWQPEGDEPHRSEGQ